MFVTRRGVQVLRRSGPLGIACLLGLCVLPWLIPACSRFDDLEEVELPPPPKSARTETREFAITVDRKPAGQYLMRISEQSDGITTMSGKASVKLSYIVYTYKYAYQGTETYRDGRLTHFSSKSNDNGKKFVVIAQAEKDGLHIEVNGKNRILNKEIWLTSYWRLPGNGSQRALTVLDADTGKEFAARLAFVGSVSRDVCGKQSTCRHYRVTATPSAVDLWYDAQGRLVRQEYVEDGHRTILELKKVEQH